MPLAYDHLTGDVRMPSLLVNAQPLAYDVYGTGPRTAICLPGMGDLRGQYRHLVPHLVAEGWRVVTLDLRGHGQSGTGFDRFTPASVASDLPALLDHLGLGSATVFANSAGAASAVLFAADHPHRVDGLVLLGPVARDPDSFVPRLLSALMGPLARLMFLPSWGAWAWTVFYRSLFKGGTPPDHEAHVAAVRASLEEPRRRRAMLENGLSSKAESGRRLGEVRAPTLIVMGASDPDFPNPTAEAHALGAALRAEVHVLPGVGHYPHQEVPERTAELVVGFLRGRACHAA
jgi:pimeloyl-ACP methyl ester carboxylesterase